MTYIKTEHRQEACAMSARVTDLKYANGLYGGLPGVLLGSPG